MVRVTHIQGGFFDHPQPVEWTLPVVSLVQNEHNLGSGAPLQVGDAANITLCSWYIHVTVLLSVVLFARLLIFYQTIMCY